MNAELLKTNQIEYLSFLKIFDLLLTTFLFSACAYVNGGMTPEQAVMLSYARGIGFINGKSQTIDGKMIAVGLSKEKITNILPEGVYIACDNSSESVTISGPKEITVSFAEELESKGIFVRNVDSCGIALHTKYIDDDSIHSYEILKMLLKVPQIRSTKWISTSVQDQQKKLYWSNYNSPEYHQNNMLNTVLFRQALEQLPDNAIVIEVAPHALLQAILKRELPATVTNIPLLNKNSENIEEYFLSAIGK